MLVGTVLVGAALWSTRVVPRWTAVAIVVCTVLNIVGFSAGSKPVLLAS